jgi:hypothetical protein
MVGDNEVRRIVESLSDLEWKLLTVQLGRYALFKSRRFYWRTGNSGELPYGEVTESIVSKAFCLWLSGRRRWNRSEYADLESFLKGVIDSLLSHPRTARTTGASIRPKRRSIFHLRRQRANYWKRSVSTRLTIL